jgi:hypothetical protein
MTISTTTFNTLPNKKDSFWQVVIIPTISVLNSIDRSDPYVAINTEWLFWSFTIILSSNDKRRIFGP